MQTLQIAFGKRFYKEHGIGPHIDGWWIFENAKTYYCNGVETIELSDNIGCILMERINGIMLMDYAHLHPDAFKEHYDTITSKLREQLNLIEPYKLSDLHTGNILINADTLAITLIDFDGCIPAGGHYNHFWMELKGLLKRKKRRK